jgi:hypothetical protein
VVLAYTMSFTSIQVGVTICTMGHSERDIGLETRGAPRAAAATLLGLQNGYGRHRKVIMQTAVNNV